MSIPDPVVLLDARARYVHPAFQMTRASTKTVFDATGKLVTVPANALGWDHDPATGQARGYLAEPSATNLLLHSNDLSESAWQKFQTSITSSAITGPDGQGMAKVVEDSASSSHSVYQSFTINDGAAVIYQLIAKAGERQSVRVQIRNQDSPTSNRAEIDVSITDGTISNANEAGTCELIDYGAAYIGGGFYFIWIAATIGSGNTSARVQAQLIDGNGNANYAGDGTSGLYLGYMQAEEGSYPTSYIETGAATATRANDGLVCSKSSLPWRNNRGTVVIDTNIGWWLDGAVLFSWGNDIVARNDTNNRLILTGNSVNGTRHLVTSLGKLRLAITWDEDEVNTARNGSLTAGPLSIVTPPSSGTIGVGSRFSGSDSWNGPIHRAVYYPARLSNADLQSLTAIQE